MTTTTLYCTLHRSNDTVYSVLFTLHFSQLPHSTQLSLTHVRYLAELSETLQLPLLIPVVAENTWNICGVLRNQEFNWLRRPTQVHSDSWAEYCPEINTKKLLLRIPIWSNYDTKQVVYVILTAEKSNRSYSFESQTVRWSILHTVRYHLSNLSYNSFVEELDNIKTSLHLFKT